MATQQQSEESRIEYIRGYKFSRGWNYNKPRTSSWGPFLLASRGGLTGGLDVALGASGKTAFVMSPLGIGPARDGLEVLSL